MTNVVLHNYFFKLLFLSSDVRCLKVSPLMAAGIQSVSQPCWIPVSEEGPSILSRNPLPGEKRRKREREREREREVEKLGVVQGGTGRKECLVVFSRQQGTSADRLSINFSSERIRVCCHETRVVCLCVCVEISASSGRDSFSRAQTWRKRRNCNLRCRIDTDFDI